MSGGNINAQKSAAYLRSVGIAISPEVEAEWRATEAAHRHRRRLHNRELRKSCGHFRSHECRVISAERGDEILTVCDDCRRSLASRPTNPHGPRGGGEPLPMERIA